MRRISSVAVSETGFSFGSEIDSAESVVAVSVFGGDQAANQRSGGARGDRNVVAAGDFNQAKSVRKGERERNVAADRCNRFDVKFGGAERQEDGHGVVDTRIRVQDDAVGLGGSRKRRFGIPVGIKR
jgi:hypothetical protein